MFAQQTQKQSQKPTSEKENAQQNDFTYCLTLSPIASVKFFFAISSSLAWAAIAFMNAYTDVISRRRQVRSFFVSPTLLLSWFVFNMRMKVLHDSENHLDFSVHRQRHHQLFTGHRQLTMEQLLCRKYIVVHYKAAKCLSFSYLF